MVTYLRGISWSMRGRFWVLLTGSTVDSPQNSYMEYVLATVVHDCIED